jgi:predicted transcriptional regulator of viral defense system
VNGGGMVLKRLGHLVQGLKLTDSGAKKRLAEWQMLLSRGISSLEPGAGRSGPVVTRWQLRINVDALSPEALK